MDTTTGVDYPHGNQKKESLKRKGTSFTIKSCKDFVNKYLIDLDMAATATATSYPDVTMK
jgi:hypothetical protein